MTDTEHTLFNMEKNVTNTWDIKLQQLRMCGNTENRKFSYKT